MHLNDGFPFRRCEMVHTFWHHCVGPGSEVAQRRWVELISHARRKGPLQHGNVFISWVPMRRDHSSISGF